MFLFNCSHNDFYIPNSNYDLISSSKNVPLSLANLEEFHVHVWWLETAFPGARTWFHRNK